MIDQIPSSVIHGLSVAIGEDLSSAELISVRRGAAMLRFHPKAGGKVAIKLAMETSDHTAPSISSINAEVAAIQGVAAANDLFNISGDSYSSNSGRLPYLKKNWIDGTPLKRNLRSLLNTDGSGLNEIYVLYRESFRFLGHIHASSWIHGDIQPDHLLLTARGVVLTDFGCAQPVGSLDPNYKGGLVHFNAPEICKSIIASEEVRPSKASDVYSMAAALYYATFEKMLGSYTTPATYQDVTLALSRGVAASVTAELDHTFNPSVASCLSAALHSDPSLRPTADGLVQILSNAL